MSLSGLSKVAVGGKDSRTDYISKPFNISFGHDHYKEELMQLKRVAVALATLHPPPDALVYRLHGVFRHGDELEGMSFTWMDENEALCQGRAKRASVELKNRWVDQVERSLHICHREGIIRGHAKAENILIDKDNNKLYKRVD
ncbi:hypothetical protein MANI_002035 [Metarhizium anisopliae]